MILDPLKIGGFSQIPGKRDFHLANIWRILDPLDIYPQKKY